MHYDNNPRQIGLNHDCNMTFSISPENVIILHLKYKFCSRSERRFACYSHCYVTWCPLTTGIVTSQHPSSRDAALVTLYLTALISTCLNVLKIILPQQNVFTSLRTSLTIVMLLLTPLISGINLKRCQWLAWSIWCHALSYTRDYFQLGICSLIKPAAMTKLISFPAKTIAVML